MRRTILVAVALSCFVPGRIDAGTNYFDGNELTERWEKYQDPPELAVKDKQSAGFCVGFVAGVVDGHRNSGVFCVPPSSVEMGQLVDVVKLYLRNHPEMRQLPAAELVASALMEKFPCN